MKKLLLVLLLVSAFACKTENKEENKSQTVVEKPVNELIVTINYKTSIDDEFKLSLNNVKVDDFQRKSIVITEKVTKTTNPDKVVANFGENFSKGFTINFGPKQVKEIEIQSIDFSYGANSLSIPPADLQKYFRFGKHITLDKESNTLKTQKVDGRHVPLIFLKQNAVNILKKGITK